MKYLTYTKNRQFVCALAALSPKLRYATAKRRWYASRLGLYHTILRQKGRLTINVRRDFVVDTISNIKRQNFTPFKAKSAIERILYNKSYRQFQTELIKEIIPFYPEIIFNFLQGKDHSYSTYYQGLSIALTHQYDDPALAEPYLTTLLLNKSESDFTDRSCLFNNIKLNNYYKHTQCIWIRKSSYYK